MKRSLALLRAWGQPVIWVAGDDTRETRITATAETPPAPVVNHYHLHLAPGISVSDLPGLGLALPPGSVVTTEEEL